MLIVPKVFSIVSFVPSMIFTIHNIVPKIIAIITCVKEDSSISKSGRYSMWCNFLDTFVLRFPYCRILVWHLLFLNLLLCEHASPIVNRFLDDI